ncbi:MAG: glycosyltransferase family 39 protein [Chloroflexi bacterium]|nr:glycosyltransferase family 39 protein [Chloroflexota bacterium]
MRDGTWVARIVQSTLAITVGLTLWLLANALPQFFPLTIRAQIGTSEVTMDIDGHVWQTSVPSPVVGLLLPSLPPHYREFAVDGSDNANMLTWEASDWHGASANLYLRFQSWLRSSSTYSQWESLRVVSATGFVESVVTAPTTGELLSLTTPASMSIVLSRLEAPRTLDLALHNGERLRLTVDPNNKLLRWVLVRSSGVERELNRSYFPFQWAPELVTVVALTLRFLALAVWLFGGLSLLAAMMPRPLTHVRISTSLLRWLTPLAACGAVGTGVWISWHLFDRAPHVLDAVSYVFQAKIFASGHLEAPAPADPSAFPTPFLVVWHNHWFSQYPPGTSALLALGMIFHMPWLIEPLLAALSIVAIAAAAKRLYGPVTGAVAAVLAVSSPFLQLQSASFLSHVPAMTFAAFALYAAIRVAQSHRVRWAMMAGAGVGAAFVCREVAGVLYGLVLTLSMLPLVRRSSLRDVVLLLGGAAAALTPFVLVWLLYNAALTGAPLLLPRELFSPSDHLGFGPGIGFYGYHTLGGGLINTDEQLTSLAITLFGWPFGLGIAMGLMPFVAQRPQPWDWSLLALIASFVALYVGYFYHGIALGPRYLFEAFPAMVILAARGLQVLNRRCLWTAPAGSGVSDQRHLSSLVLVVAGALLLCNVLYFEPHQMEIYHNWSGMPGRGGPKLGTGFTEDLSGRRVTLSHALVVTSDWWIYTTYLAVLNCPELRCGQVFAYVAQPDQLARLRALFPGRTLYMAVDSDGELDLVRTPNRSQL